MEPTTTQKLQAQPSTPSDSTLPDWVRLQKALSIESERGFNNTKGHQQLFSEFLASSLLSGYTIFSDNFSSHLSSDKWKELARRFDSYAELSFSARQHLVADTRRFLHRARQAANSLPLLAEGNAPYTIDTKGTGAKSSRAKTATESKRKSRSPKTTDVTGLVNRPDSTHPLDKPLTYLRGIGAHKAEKLAKLGLLSLRDVLFYYPRDYIDYARQVKIKDLVPGETVTLVATVKKCSCFNSPRNSKLTIFEMTVYDATSRLKISRFLAGTHFRSRGWQERQKRLYPPGAVVAISGLVKQTKYGINIDSPEIEVLGGPDEAIASLTVGRVVPVYPLTEGVGADIVRKAVVAALPAVVELRDPLPSALRQKYELVELAAAIAHIHFPPSTEALAVARRRLVFDEFFYLQLGLLRRRAAQQQAQTSVQVAPTGQLIEAFYKVLPFQFTNAQQRVAQEILNDLQKTAPMNRLVQGDVGSGKTVVAVVGILAAIQAGYQAALMAPTEVLAEQHYRKLVEWFNLLHLPVELLTGSTRAAKRRQIHSELLTGELPVLVGTHALIEDPVQFHNLGLVTIDEQHRFGVAQRAKLQQKGDNPHVLTLTATPIPRTLALTIHGDLDVSQIDELPPGRKAVKTTVLGAKERSDAYDLIRREIVQGRQVYIVLPLVEESEKLDLRSAIEEGDRLQETIFPDFQVGLLHGRMSSVDKDAAISAFRDQTTQILVSTTVVEVGVDIPNATVMLIEHAERFGLSQLHQLRGRVGRGGDQSFCLLMTNSKSDVAMQRLRVMEQSQDGFFISEMDMRFRGPGQVLGTRQSGLPDFALASLVEDQDVLELARTAAGNVLAQESESGDGLTRWPLMEKELERRYQKLMGGAILT
ncbi:ATP-dependent DNA helicase RecG [Synechococcus sp. PCC 7335]|uniref:ATP-dependent DNA helicase RecG n=1 Tax=Synechococcus sp. (strain ATCC 29403 / PCC 7335) TaxID=91464 RepID=UPI00017EB103|nr:ATP-dependent DNA helicase RecG [Synechococcus sp. PCC 7335]EDX86430.1 ATP-dependent DNA helicase RecG [Synechococcus sp. PCC 7335]